MLFACVFLFKRKYFWFLARWMISWTFRLLCWETLGFIYIFYFSSHSTCLDIALACFCELCFQWQFNFQSPSGTILICLFYLVPLGHLLVLGGSAWGGRRISCRGGHLQPGAFLVQGVFTLQGEPFPNWVLILAEPQCLWEKECFQVRAICCGIILIAYASGCMVSLVWGQQSED